MNQIELANLRARAREAEALKPVVVPVKSEAEITAMMDNAALDEARVRADAVLAEFGRAAPLPIMGESSLDYRKRAVNETRITMAVKPLGLETFAEPELAKIEDRVFVDAMRESRAPRDIPDGMVREIIKSDRSGRAIHEFRANPNPNNRTFQTVYGESLARPGGFGIATKNSQGQFVPVEKILTTY